MKSTRKMVLLYDFGARQYDSRIGRFNSSDPKEGSFAFQSPYLFASNQPISLIDKNGENSEVTVTKNKDEKGNETGGGKINISTTVYITGKNASEEKANRLTKFANEELVTKTSLDGDGNKWEVSFSVKYKYVSNTKNLDKKSSENVLRFRGEVGRSHIKARWLKGHEGEIERTGVGYRGNIYKDEVESEYYENRTVLHETLHFLGLEDRYSDNPITGYSEANDGFDKDIMGTLNYKEISQVHYDNYRRYFSKKNEGSYINRRFVDKDRKGNLINSD